MIAGYHFELTSTDGKVENFCINKEKNLKSFNIVKITVENYH